jgi:hypothetical protein
MDEQDKPLGAPKVQSDHSSDQTPQQKPKRKLNWKGFAIGIIIVIIIEFFAISMLNSPDPEIPIQPPTESSPTATLSITPTLTPTPTK